MTKEKEIDIKKLKKLTPKQKLFVREYLKDFCAKHAAIRAGYSVKTAEWIGPQVIKLPHVAIRVKRLIDKRAERVEVSADYVLGTIKDTVERCRQATPVYDRSGNLAMVETDDGEVQPVYAFDPKNVLKGCELLGKHLGMFVEKVDIYNGGDSNLTHDERAQLARKRMIQELGESPAENEPPDEIEDDIEDEPEK